MHRPLASFSTMFQIYAPQHPNPKLPAAIAKPKVVAAVAAVAALPPLEKKKIKITVAKKTSASTSPAAPPPVSPLPAPPSAPASHAPVSASPRTKKIKITIKKQPKQEQQRVDTCYHLHDFAPPVSMIYTPCSDYIVPPPKCCRFFIENRHCFLRSSDNACIDPINKKVFGFWNCEIGKKCELLPPSPTDDDDLDQYHDGYETIANLVQLDNNDDDDCNKIDAFEMRKKSDANRARITGQPVALLRQKIATKYGMLWCRR